ncbi:branched-chain alpha-keto acid dehydrogenase subunit E2 [Rhodococcoides fascians]|uniref:dihydrolipoamide acetyltransferase family protein n=1 Tax=Rhodococcoides fascians TaxID=1828 RepID=UPI000B9B1C43|nr:dihydrolipoamide acetyltransferase family protein [Rhodococcus fascians]OZE93449.1 branched-chain alpha-keto acid dehydrogenase subunit E2 [Rhodococcus fascians]OZF24057.1 branched-chain alpha-keto acid dehydrogenase subunit E2 [Rhodococcus fascians]OZF25281.1 branched-chain alpha-keto acid dehydrogenase subunit E2 [Rhodococcus fascians]OZF73571.1 branched-chain alpha-keto acid dehydrogenase subunit E2 [Rhodococcus fascians]OZF74409.1 branched-chain alpha-keto acid dehydrogenase subunit E2 
MSTIKSFPLPDLGEGLTEADLLTWLVAVGDTIELNQNIAEVETAKAAVELPSPFAGVVAALHVSEGDTVEVGVPIIDIRVGGDDEPVATDPEQSVSPIQTTSSGEDEDERVPVLVGYGVAKEGSSRRGGRVDPPAASAPNDRNGKPLAAPPVRKMAKDIGVDLNELPASGRHGDVTRQDVESYLQSGSDVRSETDVQQSVSGRTGREERTPIKGVRKHTAEAMVRSAFTAPHVTEFVTVDVTETLELLESLRSSTHFRDVRLTPLALVSKAVLVALKSNPSLNSSWDEAAQEIVTKYYVNLGIAAATPRGLMVPSIKNAHELSLVDIARAVADLTRIAKEGKSSPADLADGTITITNVGVFGVDAGTPILNPGEAAILCFGSIRRTPWEHNGEIALRSVTTLSLSFDHRLVDGQQGSEFLALVGRLLTHPIDLIALG